MYDFLTQDLEHNVIPVSGDIAQPFHAAGTDLVIVSETNVAADVNTKFTDQNLT